MICILQTFHFHIQTIQKKVHRVSRKCAGQTNPKGKLLFTQETQGLQPIFVPSQVSMQTMQFHPFPFSNISQIYNHNTSYLCMHSRKDNTYGIELYTRDIYEVHTTIHLSIIPYILMNTKMGTNHSFYSTNGS
jgi:hypothetical protein